jgi:hypothetical protein
VSVRGDNYRLRRLPVSRKAQLGFACGTFSPGDNMEYRTIRHFGQSMQNDFSTLSIADGCITRLVAERGELRLSIQDWREEVLLLVFHDVVGIEAFRFVNDDLSHADEDCDDPFVTRSCAAAEEKSDNYRCFAFFSVNSDAPILKVVARSFSLEQVH